MKTISLIVRDQLFPDGTIGYFLDRTDFGSPVFNRIESLVGPDGVALEQVPPFYNTRRFATLESLDQAAIGEWTFTSAPAANPSAVEEYHFSIASFLGADINLVRPNVETNPGPTPNSFKITWGPSVNTYSLLIDTSKASYDSPAGGNLDVSFLPSAVSPVKFRTWTSQSLNPFITAPTPLSGNPTYEVFTSLNYYRSTEASVSPVPEPNSMLMIAGSGAMLLMLRGRFRAPLSLL